MDDKELWNTFEETGCVWDYLNYKGIRAIMESEKHESDDSDGNDTVRNADRRI